MASDLKEIYQKARSAEKSGRIDEAVNYYNECLKQDAFYRPAIMNLGVISSRLRKHEEAYSYFKKAVSIRQDTAALFNLGSECYQLKKYEEAVRYLKGALKLESRFFRAHLLLAYIYEGQDQPDKAEVYFRNSLKLDPSSRIATLGMILLLSESGRYSEAIQFAESYKQKAKPDTTIQNLLAGLYLKVKDYKKSAEELSAAVKQKSYASFTDHLAKAREEKDAESEQFFTRVNEQLKQKTAELRKKLEAKKQTANAETEEAKDYVDLSLMYLFSGKTEEAMKLLVQARKSGESADG